MCLKESRSKVESVLGKAGFFSGPELILYVLDYQYKLVSRDGTVMCRAYWRLLLPYFH